MNKINNIPEAEIKLGLNIARDIYTILTTDTPQVAELRKSLSDIDVVLKGGLLEELLICNAKMVQKHEDIIFSVFSTKNFIRVSKNEMLEKSPIEQFATLRDIGYVIKNRLMIKKAGQGLGTVAKSIGEYVITKQLEKYK